MGPSMTTPLFRVARFLFCSALALSAVIAAAEEGVRWTDLPPDQQSALRPLQREWAQIDAPRKQKWIEIAGRFGSMPPAEQSRVQARMKEWAQMSPSQRRDARMNYQAARQVPAQNKQARWEAYQALPAEQRRQLAQPVPAAPERRSGSARAPAGDVPQAKSNIVPNPSHAVPPRPVAPTVVQAKPGATTTLMSSRPAPPAHQQTGMPKIAATPGFVDKSTLLPQRGPQGAAVRSAASASDAAARRQ
jgi:hypothetical protein